MRPRAKRSDGEELTQKGSAAAATAPAKRPNVSESPSLCKQPPPQQQQPTDVSAGSRVAADSEATIGAPAEQRPAAAATAAAADNNNRRVFGLNPRANKSRHDEYVERRASSSLSAAADAQVAAASESSPRPTDETKPTKAASNKSSADSKPLIETTTVAAAAAAGKIRASKYGNFYRPAVDSAPTVEPIKQRAVPVKQRASSESPERRRKAAAAADQQPTGGGGGSGETVKEQPATKLSQASPNPAASNEAAEIRPRRREDKYKMATEGSQPAQVKSEQGSPVKRATTKAPQQEAAAGQRDEQQPARQPPARMQFNIPPPPKLNSGSLSKSSIISYAKARIYDKPQHSSKSAAAAAALAGGANILDSSGAAIPESILSGFKPPKQVNVSKARERWEGGEPFAKCKSRQRLAASANNKKVLYGTWSMTSVVATQQLQFQQALSANQAKGRSSNHLDSNQLYLNSDSPVKILTRGSVLERVQQYEQAPPAGNGGSNLRAGSSLSSSTGSLSVSSSTGSSGPSDSESGSSSPGSSSSDDRSPPADEASLSIGHYTDPSAAVAAAKVNSKQPTTVHSQPLATAAAATPTTTTTKTTVKSPPIAEIPSLNGRRFSFRRRSSTSSLSGPSAAIPRFYHPNGKPNTYEIELQKKNIVACFDKFTDRKALLTAPAYKRHFHSIALACGFTEYFKEPLYRYIKHQLTDSNLLHNTGASGMAAQRKQSGVGPSLSNGTTGSASISANNIRRATSLTRAASIDNSTVEKLQNQNYISCEQFLTCWRHIISNCFDNAARFVHLLTLGQRNYLLPDDFVPLIQSVIDDHPGLKFLRSAPDFHMRYIQTVIARIYFCINRSWTGKISLSELRRGNLLQVLELLSREEDINQVTDYFSYEHFYVIYCKFWSLDQDHDLLISKEDLARHNDASISSRIIDRIFSGAVSKRIQETGKMSYPDFVWFLIAEEDKKHPRSVEYWFRIMDMDGDGFISMYEMEYFYYEQTKRLELMNIEALPFLDSACQILDLINPKEKNKISLSDLKKTKLATIFFDTFINLEKYLEHESREFVSSRDVIQNGQVVSDWDRYASEAYESLVTEESSV